MTLITDDGLEHFFESSRRNPPCVFCGCSILLLDSFKEHLLDKWIISDNIWKLWLLTTNNYKQQKSMLFPQRRISQIHHFARDACRAVQSAAWCRSFLLKSAEGFDLMDVKEVNIRRQGTSTVQCSSVVVPHLPGEGCSPPAR